MSDFTFIQNPTTHQYVILAPNRSIRPNEALQHIKICPFCPGREKEETELFRIGGSYPDQNWQTRVIANKYPFAPDHEIIIHSPDHHKNIDELSLPQVEKILQTYKNRFQTLQKKGNVYIFHNHGIEGGESLPHPHTQIVLIPFSIQNKIPLIEFSKTEIQATSSFNMFAPWSSQWPDEIWITPKRQQTDFGQINDVEIIDLAYVLQRLIQILNFRHGNEFPYNFYIAPFKNWYLRLIPRSKSLGGFEIGTGIYVNTQNPKETIEFIQAHFENPDKEKIKTEHPAKYRKGI